MMVTWSPPAPAPDIWSRESGMPGERGAGLCRPLPYLGKTCGLGRGETPGPGTGCDVLTWHCVQCYLWPGLAWAVMTGMSRHVTWGVTGDRAQTGSGIYFISVLAPSLWYSLVLQPGASRLGSPRLSQWELGIPSESQWERVPGVCPYMEVGVGVSESWPGLVGRWDQWHGARCRLQEALLSVPGPGLAGAGWRFYMLAGPISQTLTRQRTSRQWTLWQQFT